MIVLDDMSFLARVQVIPRVPRTDERLIVASHSSDCYLPQTILSFFFTGLAINQLPSRRFPCLVSVRTSSQRNGIDITNSGINSRQGIPLSGTDINKQISFIVLVEHVLLEDIRQLISIQSLGPAGYNHHLKLIMSTVVHLGMGLVVTSAVQGNREISGLVNSFTDLTRNDQIKNGRKVICVVLPHYECLKFRHIILKSIRQIENDLEFAQLLISYTLF